MNRIDPLKLVSDLKPAMLDRLAEEGYARRRYDDLARAVAAGPGPASATVSRRPSRGHGRRWRVLAASIAVTGAAAGLIAGVVVSASGGAPTTTARSSGHHVPALPAPAIKLTAQQVLDRLSTAAAAAPRQKGRYVELTETDRAPAVNDPNLQKILARIKSVPALRKEYLGTLKKLKDMPSVMLFRRTSVIDRLTGDTWTYQQGSGVPSELPVARHGSLTAAQFAAWPTDPVALRALLISQGKQLVAEKEEVPGETDDDLVFQQASNWLWNPVISPALRSALYKVLAATPAVVVKTGTKDSTGRSAIEISRFDSAAGQDFATFEDPATGAVLESVSSGPDPGVSSAVYQPITSYATLPADPYRG
jgi:hypothetical protein